MERGRLRTQSQRKQRLQLERDLWERSRVTSTSHRPLKLNVEY